MKWLRMAAEHGQEEARAFLERIERGEQAELDRGSTDPRRQSAAFARQQFEAAVVGAGDALDDGQSQPGAAGVGARRFAARKGRLMRSTSAGGMPGRGRSTSMTISPAFSGQREFDRFGAAAIAQGVVDQVADGAAQGLRPTRQVSWKVGR